MKQTVTKSKSLLKILFQDEFLVAIQKPHGLLVHHSSIASDVTEVCVQTLRDQIGQKVYPVHRLDRQTGGVLLFGLDSDTTRKMQHQFVAHEIDKVYLSVVRGFTDDEGTIDHPLKTDRGNLQEALTHYKTLRRFEVPIAIGKFNSSRYSLVEVKPKSGRTHQIRRHFAHISHPIIGDRRHGCNRQNNLFRDHEMLGLQTMLLHASSLKFKHPETSEEMTIQAELQTPFRMIVDTLTSSSLSREEIEENICQERAQSDNEKKLHAASRDQNFVIKGTIGKASCSVNDESDTKRQKVDTSESVDNVSSVSNS